MNDVIIVEMAADGLSPIRAGAASADGQWLRSIAINDLDMEAGKEAVIVLDGSLVVVIRVAVPDFPDVKLLKILPGLMDVTLGQAKDIPHFAVLTERDASAGDRLVATIEPGVLQSVISKIESLGLIVRAVMPDYMLLSIEDQADEAVMTPEGRMLARRADATGFAAEADLGRYMLPADSRAVEMSSSDWQQRLAKAVLSPATLLQGSFGPHADISAWLVWFRRAAVLALVAFLLWAGGAYFSAGRNFEQADRLHAATEDQFRTALPDVSRIVNMEAQMRRAILRLREQDGSEFLVLSSLAAEAVAGQDVTMLESMRFDTDAGTLAVSISFASYADGEQFKATLQKLGLVVTEGNSRAEGNRVLSELTIRRQV